MDKHRYLYAYPSNIFNSDTPLYEIEPLSGSELTKLVVFAGKSPMHTARGFTDSVCYFYLEAGAPIDSKNIYRNLRIYENLLCLNTGKPTPPGNGIDISEFPDLDSILAEFAADADSYNQPGIQHQGLVREYNSVKLMPYCTHWMNRMESVDREKVERSLQTFIIAEEIGQTVNSHTKASVRATLYLSAINQLAEKTEYCPHKIAECPDCGKPIIHQRIGHAKRIEELMRKLFTGENLEQGIQLIKSGYYSVRSPFLHEGVLSGGENEGGWIADNPENLQFEENLVNYMNTCRQLIQLFIQAGVK